MKLVVEETFWYFVCGFFYSRKKGLLSYAEIISNMSVILETEGEDIGAILRRTINSQTHVWCGNKVGY